MNFGFSEEQNLLREQVLRFMHQHCPMPRVRELVASRTSFLKEFSVSRKTDPSLTFARA